MSKKSKTHKRSKDKTGWRIQLEDRHYILSIFVLVLIFFKRIIFKEAYFWEDFIHQYFPFRSFAATSLAEGIIPFWNPYTFGGMPFLADVQTAFFYPLNLLLTFCVKDGKLHYLWLEYLLIFHYFLAGLFAYLFSKSLDLSKWASAISAIVFPFSGFLVSHLIHQTMVFQLTWLPLIFLFVNKSFQKGEPEVTVISGIVLSVAILAGHPQISLYIFFVLFLFWLFHLTLLVKENGVKARPILKITITFFLVVVIALAIASVQLLPTFELSKLSTRAEFSYEQSVEGSIGFFQLFVTLIVPKFFGSTNAAGDSFPYWGPTGYWNFWETCVYVGILPLILSIFAALYIRENTYVAFFCGLAVFSLLYALGDHGVLHKLFFTYVPGFNKFRLPARFSIFFTLSISVLSGFGANYFINDFKKRRAGLFNTYLLMSIAAFAFAWLLFCLVPFRDYSPYLQNQEIQKNMKIEAGKCVLIAVISLFPFILLRRERVTTAVVPVVFIILIFADLYLFGAHQNNGKVNPETFYKNDELVNFLHKEGESEYFRVNARRDEYMLLRRNQGMLDRLFLLEGYTPLNLSRKFPPINNPKRNDILNVKFEIAVDEKRQSMSLVRRPTYLPRAYLVHKVKVIEVGDQAVIDFMNSEEFDPKEMIVLEERPNVRWINHANPARSNVRITKYTLNEMTIETNSDQDGFLFLSEIYYPAWKVYVDGKRRKIFRANYNLRAAYVEKGNHVVEFKYESGYFRMGATVSCVTLLISALRLTYRTLCTTFQRNR